MKEGEQSIKRAEVEGRLTRCFPPGERCLGNRPESESPPVALEFTGACIRCDPTKYLPDAFVSTDEGGTSTWLLLFVPLLLMFPFIMLPPCESTCEGPCKGPAVRMSSSAEWPEKMPSLSLPSECPEFTTPGSMAAFSRPDPSHPISTGCSEERSARPAHRPVLCPPLCNQSFATGRLVPFHGPSNLSNGAPQNQCWTLCFQMASMDLRLGKSVGLLPHPLASLGVLRLEMQPLCATKGGPPRPVLPLAPCVAPSAITCLHTECCERGPGGNSVQLLPAWAEA